MDLCESHHQRFHIVIARDPTNPRQEEDVVVVMMSKIIGLFVIIKCAVMTLICPFRIGGGMDCKAKGNGWFCT